MHVTARGNRRQEIFRDDTDRARLIALLDAACERSKWRLHAYCLMPNHYHLVIELAEPTLSDGFQWLNGVYARLYALQMFDTGGTPPAAAASTAAPAAAGPAPAVVSGSAGPESVAPHASTSHT